MKPVLSSFSPGYKIAYLFLLMLVGVVVAGIATNLVLRIPLLANGGALTAIYVGTIAQSLLATALPAYLIAGLTHSNPFRFLGMNKSRGMAEKISFAILAFVFSYFMASFLAQWNKGMELPPFMSSVEQAMRTMEDTAQETTQLLLSGKTIDRLILNLIVVAGLAAFSEEIFFRGALQQFIEEKFPGKHAAVWITALIFSLVHFQFYGFLPRLLLGALLGYLFFYTRSLWAPILFHFLNNAVIVVIHYFWGDTEWMRRVMEKPADGGFLLMAGVSALCTISLFKVYQWRNSHADYHSHSEV